MALNASYSSLNPLRKQAFGEISVGGLKIEVPFGRRILTLVILVSAGLSGWDCEAQIILPPIKEYSMRDIPIDDGRFETIWRLVVGDVDPKVKTDSEGSENREPEAARVMPKAVFQQLLKSGMTWVVSKGEEELKCKTCAGFGRVTNTLGGVKDPDGKMLCDQCQGVGKQRVPIRWKILW